MVVVSHLPRGRYRVVTKDPIVALIRVETWLHGAANR